MDEQLQYGDKVVFTDEFGKERVGSITNPRAWDTEGLVSISGTYGDYTRQISEVRLAQHWEVHRLEFN